MATKKICDICGANAHSSDFVIVDPETRASVKLTVRAVDATVPTVKDVTPRNSDQSLYGGLFQQLSFRLDAVVDPKPMDLCRRCTGKALLAWASDLVGNEPTFSEQIAQVEL